jgi:hypothetical protein
MPGPLPASLIPKSPATEMPSEIGFGLTLRWESIWDQYPLLTEERRGCQGHRMEGTSAGTPTNSWEAKKDKAISKTTVQYQDGAEVIDNPFKTGDCQGKERKC